MRDLSLKKCCSEKLPHALDQLATPDCNIPNLLFSHWASQSHPLPLLSIMIQAKAPSVSQNRRIPTTSTTTLYNAKLRTFRWVWSPAKDIVFNEFLHSFMIVYLLITFKNLLFIYSLFNRWSGLKSYFTLRQLYMVPLKLQSVGRQW
jgi:hypothetical protein